MNRPKLHLGPRPGTFAAEVSQAHFAHQQLERGACHTVASFDIGAYHLAFCIMSYHPGFPSGYKYHLWDWQVVNILSEERLSCQACQSRAAYQIRHITSTSTPHTSTPHTSTSTPPPAPWHGYCRTHVRPFLEDASYIVERHLRLDTATPLDLNVQIIKALDRYPQLLECDEIVLESQPEFNPKMKNISFMIFSYFACRARVDHPDSRVKDIRFVYSKNKLTVYQGPPISAPVFKKAYDRNKYLSPRYCEALIALDLPNLAFFRTHRKRDDLADCFLQGAWYLANQTTHKISHLK